MVTEKYLCEKCNVLARKICQLIFKVCKLNEILGLCCSVLDPESRTDALPQNINNTLSTNTAQHHPRRRKTCK